MLWNQGTPTLDFGHCLGKCFWGLGALGLWGMGVLRLLVLPTQQDVGRAQVGCSLWISIQGNLGHSRGGVQYILCTHIQLIEWRHSTRYFMSLIHVATLALAEQRIANEPRIRYSMDALTRQVKVYTGSAIILSYKSLYRYVDCQQPRCCDITQYTNFTVQIIQ